jgi:(1->4)-alpha-D-glucan 1-alpha-D-glucosylmutase
MNRALCLRRARRAVFLQGEYTPLAASGALSNHVVAFARGTGEQQIIVVTGRYFTRLMSDGAPVGDVWAGNTLALSDEQAGRYRDVLTGQQFYAKQGETGWGLSLDEVFAHLPVALLERVN